MRAEISAEWRAAILRARTDEYPGSPGGPGEQTWLGAILGDDPTLAFDWLRARLGDPDLPGHAFASGPFGRAVRALDQEQRRALLDDLQPHPILGSLLPWLVGNDLILYSGLLLRPDLRDYHLDPLGGLPDETWVAKATLALDAGYLPEDVAGAAYRTSHSWAGFGNEYWTRWKEAFAALQDNQRSDLREVARFGIAEAEKELETARRKRKRFELEGA